MLGGGRVGQQFEEQVFDRVQVRDYQGKLVEFVGFPETGAPGLAFQAYQTEYPIHPSVIYSLIYGGQGF